MRGADIIEAVVQVGVEETRYLRCGRGDRIVVVLAEDPAERRRLIERLSEDHRVIAPVPYMARGTSDPASRLEAWLRGVIDGLGLDGPVMVVSPGLAWLGDCCGDVVEGVIVSAEL